MARIIDTPNGEYQVYHASEAELPDEHPDRDAYYYRPIDWDGSGEPYSHACASDDAAEADAHYDGECEATLRAEILAACNGDMTLARAMGL